MSILWVPKPSPLFVDKLSMTYAVSDNDTQMVVKNFIDVIDEFYGGKIWESKTYYFNKKVYIDGEYILFQCGPKGKKMNLFRVDYNPAKVHPAEVKLIANLVFPGGYKELIDYGRITGIDIATDVKYLPIGDLYFQFPELSICSNHLKSGSIQTANLGNKKSANHFTLYDKRAEIKVNNNNTQGKLKQAVPPYSLARIEWKHRPKEICTFKMLSNIENVFAKLSLSVITGQPKKPKTDFDGLVKLVFELSKYHGLQQALFNVPKYQKKAVMDTIMKSGKKDWWKPQELWQTLPAALEHITNHV